MRLEVFAIYDRKLMVYEPPFCAHNGGHAARMMVDLRDSGRHTMSRHPGDFEVWLIGYYDDACARFVSHGPELVFKIGELSNELEASVGDSDGGSEVSGVSEPRGSDAAESE